MGHTTTVARLRIPEERTLRSMADLSGARFCRPNLLAVSLPSPDFIYFARPTKTAMLRRPEEKPAFV